MRVLLLAICAAPCLLGCGGSAVTIPIPDPGPSYVALVQRNQHNATGPYTFVFNDATSFGAYWRAAFGSGSDAPSKPVVDFAAKTILVIAPERVPSGGYGLVVDGVIAVDEANELQVWYALVRPGPGCSGPPEVSAPVLIGVTERHEGAVTFIRSDRAGPACNGPGLGESATQ